jgi:hypothetical protein
MPLPGRPPKPDGQKRNRVRLGHDWNDYPDVPFADPPRLPSRGDGLAWPNRTRKWWKGVSTMPHCVDWTDSDWQFAFDAALLAALFHLGDTKVEGALRAREKVMGTTADYRRNLRIRYVSAGPATDAVEEQGDGTGAAVLSLDDYRRAILED